MNTSIAYNLSSLILYGVDSTGKDIGRGAYGRVFEVDYEGMICAAKEIHALLLQSAYPDELKKIKDNFLSECQIWSTLRHPCVVQFLGNVILSSVMIVTNDCDVIRSVLSRNRPVQFTCYGNGEDAA